VNFSSPFFSLQFFARKVKTKGTDFDTISDEEIERVEYLINTRPRKRFNGLNPFEMFYKLTGVALDS